MFFSPFHEYPAFIFIVFFLCPCLNYLTVDVFEAIRVSKPGVHAVLDPTAWSSVDLKLQKQKRKQSSALSALAESAASVAIAAAVVGAAATILVRRTKSTDAAEIQLKTCEDCDGSGICSECRGEGFVLKKLSDENADRLRLNAKNMATRYTAA